MRALLPLLGLLFALPAPAADEAAAATQQIVQQRLPDGSIVLTDRPLGDAETLCTWQFQPEDPRLAAERRAAAQREGAAVSERIARRLEQQREIDRELELARLQAALAAAEREAALARAYAQAEPQQLIVWPQRRLQRQPHWKRPPQWRVHPPKRPLPPGHSLQRHAPNKPLGPNRQSSDWPW